MKKTASFLFNGMLWALVLASFLLGGFAGLPSFVPGAAFWAGTAAFCGLQAFLFRKDERGIGMVGSFVSLCCCFLGCLTFLGADGLASIPGGIIAVGCADGLAAVVAGVALAAVLIALGALIVRDGIANPRPYAYSPDPDKAKVERTGRIARWITFAVLAVILIVCACVPSVHQALGSIAGMLASGDIGAVVDYLRQFGAQAAIVSGSLMVLQSLAAPIPAFIITLANAVLFGWWQGAILSWSSAMVGAAICFGIARVLGRDAVTHFMAGSAIEAVDRFFDRFGTHAILICRLLPFMSFDYVSYAAGLTSIGFWKFMLATGIGQLPATIVYSYVGGTLTGGAQALMIGLLVAFSAAILVFIIFKIFKNRHADLMDADANVSDGGSDA